MSERYTLERLPTPLAIARLASSEAVPDWARGELTSVTRSDRELSIVCDAARVPGQVRAERNWIAYRVAGTLDFDQVGVVAALSGVLRDAGISLFILSTFDTDYILVRLADAAAAADAWRAAGHEISAA